MDGLVDCANSQFSIPCLDCGLAAVVSYCVAMITVPKAVFVEFNASADIDLKWNAIPSMEYS